MYEIVLRFAPGPEVLVTIREGTKTVSDLIRSLPFRSVAHRWGDEVYFDAPFHAGRESDAREEMEVGDAAYWPDGDAIALFFGPTPVSTDGKPRAYSSCNIIGRVSASPESLKAVKEGAKVEVTQA